MLSLSYAVDGTILFIFLCVCVRQCLYHCIYFKNGHSSMPFLINPRRELLQERRDISQGLTSYSVFVFSGLVLPLS